MAGSNVFDPGHLFGHVQDADHIEVSTKVVPSGKIDLPQPLRMDTPLWTGSTGVKSVDDIGIFQPIELKFTKFMLLELIVALVIAVVFIRLANKMSHGDRPKGRMWNLLEAMILFIRDEVARPAIGDHDADRFLPFLWTLFFFVLGCNLFGLVPWAGSATGALATTGALAFITFAVVVGSGMSKLGAFGFVKSLVPHMDLPLPMYIVLLIIIFPIEVLGLLIKHFVLAVRLLANMMAGHLVLAVIVAFIAASAGSAAFWGVMPASVLGATALNLLELFVAFLQAYIFTFLSALFIGAAVHPH